MWRLPRGESTSTMKLEREGEYGWDTHFHTAEKEISLGYLKMKAFRTKIEVEGRKTQRKIENNFSKGAVKT